MKAHFLFRLLPLFAIAGASADTFELKDGTKLEGTILREDGADYILEVQVTKSIRDERRVPKADVVKQIAEKKDETAFEEIAKLVPTPDLLNDAEYASRSRKVKAFLKKFPKSPKNTDARKILDTLENERAAVSTGGVKFNGKIISAEERAPNAYALDAKILATEIETAAAAGDVLTALRAWTKLEKEYQGSSAYVSTIPKILTVMKSYLGSVTSTLAGYDARVKERAANLAGMAVGDRTRSEQAIAEVENAYTARLAREKADGEKWVSVDAYQKQPLEETKRKLESEIRRLGSINTDNFPKTEEAYETAYAEITKPEVTKQEVDTALSKARSASMPQAYLDLLAKAAPEFPTP
ncbi:PTPDL family protein [Luteolibacter marinus]|uniref:PTPDL family protein n=1 Tax=Luteolibacter marinus TaxID=2776705 RepID=UPI0018665897|nr:PTPDL family protein [Luteolibacter marinus]